MGPTGFKQKGAWVGCMVRDPIKIATPKLKTRRARQLYEQGVLGVYIINTGERAVVVGTLYGRTGGHEKEAAAQCTDGIIEALVAELEGHKGVPRCLMGDSNADPGDIPTIEHLIENEKWVDCGAKAGIWGQISCESHLQGTQCEA